MPNSALGAEVALEVDRIDDVPAWSVLARGRLRRLDEDEQTRLDDVLPLAWLSTPKYEAVELVPSVVSGRCFVLHRADEA